MDFEHSDGFAKTIFSAIPTYNSREPVVVPASLKYFMELCDEVELVYQRLRVFSGSKKRLPTGGCRGLDFGNTPFGVAGFPSFSAFSHLRKPVHLPHALRGWIL